MRILSTLFTAGVLIANTSASKVLYPRNVTSDPTADPTTEPSSTETEPGFGIECYGSCDPTPTDCSGSVVTVTVTETPTCSVGSTASPICDACICDSCDVCDVCDVCPTCPPPGGNTTTTTTVYISVPGDDIVTTVYDVTTLYNYTTVVVYTTEEETVTETATRRVPTTVLVETTYYETETEYRTSYETIYVENTITETRTFTTEYPVTIVSDRSLTFTSLTTEVITAVETYTTRVPVISTIVGEDITVTREGAERIVTLEGEDRTITIEGGVTTLPGTTVVRTVTEELPGETITVTRDGQTFTTVLPGSTTVFTTVETIGPETLTIEGATVTVSAIVEVTLCPKVTGESAPLAPESDLTWGCKPGFVCNPRKPAGCNLWPAPPADDYLCNPKDCIPAPPITNITWEDDETSYYPPEYGYFNLNPEAFGLSYDIFEFSTYEEHKDGELQTVTTGNWASQSTLTDWPQTSTATPAHYDKRSYKDLPGRASNILKREGVTPAICYDDCNGAYKIAQQVGKKDDLCRSGSSFRESYQICAECITDNTEANKFTIRRYVEPEFSQFLGYCDGRGTTPAGAGGGRGPESIVESPPDVETTAQAQASTERFTPIETTVERPDPPAEPTTREPEPTTADEPEPTTADEPESTPVAPVTQTQPPTEPTETAPAEADSSALGAGGGGSNTETAEAGGPSATATGGSGSGNGGGGGGGGGASETTVSQPAGATNSLETSTTAPASGEATPSSVVTAAAPHFTASSSLLTYLFSILAVLFI